MSKPLILVSGATGAQGKPVAKTLASMGYPVRGLSRNPAAEKAKAAAIDGVEMVKASLQNKADLKAAFAGVERAFLVTQFWEKLDVADEILQVRGTREHTMQDSSLFDGVPDCARCLLHACSTTSSSLCAHACFLL